MRAIVLDSVSDIDSTTWNAIVGRNRLICRHEYLKAVESSQINDCRYFYPVIYDGDQIVAHTCLYFISTELDLFAKGVGKLLVNAVRHLWPSFMILRSIECGTPVALGSTISFREGVDQHAVLNMIVQATETVAREQGVRVLLFRDFHDNELELFDSLTSKGYTRLHNLPCARMRVEWDSFEAYLNAMRSQYRCKLLAQQKRFRESGATIQILSHFSSMSGDLARLWHNVYERATDYRREVLLPDFFENIDRGLADRSELIVAIRDNEPQGFLMLLHDDETLIPLFIGLDYSSSRNIGTYFNLFYEAIRIAIDTEKRDIDLGITTLEPKVDLGAIAIPLHMYMKHLTPTLNMIVPRMFAMATPAAIMPSSKVLK
ncbi:MAG: GNAT family N-acetyltransferase [Verrucomicrobia bacterium]|jgi:predicted N-acyltransferase|nr:GNAT family N-acetyltransferase [Verrucomicrobiota bacterium]